MSKAKVAVLKCRPETILQDIERLTELAGMKSALAAGKTTILKDNISWQAPPEFLPENVDYYASQGSATRLFWWGEARDRLDGWRMREVAALPCFAYFAAGGFSGPKLGGRFIQGLMHGLDRVATLCPRAFAGRLLVVLEKEPL